MSFSSIDQSCPTLCDPMNFSTPGLPVRHQLPEFTQTHIHWVGDAFCRPLFLLPPIPPSIRVFSNESTLRMRWPEYWSFRFSIIPSKEHPGLISFRIDWLDLLAVHGTLKSLLQHHSSKASILWRSAFFTVQLSHPYMTTGKIIALTRWTFVGKVMSLLLNMLSRLAVTFLPRSKRLLISWLQSPSAVILEQLHFHFSLSCIREGNGTPLQYSCLENPRDRGAWWAAIYGVTQSRTRLKWLSSSSSKLKSNSQY